MSCIICNSPTNLMSSKCEDGSVCKNCLSLLPGVVKKQIKPLHKSDIKKILIWDNKNHKDYISQFCVTSSYGRLYIDDVHGLFAICEKNEIKNGNIVDLNHNIFSFLELKDMGFTMKTSNVEEGSVTVSIVFSCEMNNPDIKFQATIKDSAKCFAHRIDSERISYYEPEELTLFRSMFYQSYKNTLEKYNYNFKRQVATKEEFDIFKAKCIFMVGDLYTKEEIDNQLKRFKKAYSDPADDTKRYKECVKVAYNILLRNLNNE